MAGYHFLRNAEGGQFLRLIGEGENRGPHCLELLEMGGCRYLRITLGAKEPGSGGLVLSCKLSRGDAQRIAQAAEDLVHRIDD